MPSIRNLQSPIKNQGSNPNCVYFSVASFLEAVIGGTIDPNSLIEISKKYDMSGTVPSILEYYVKEKKISGYKRIYTLDDVKRSIDSKIPVIASQTKPIYHNILITGYNPLEYKNSWGESWGDKGYGTFDSLESVAINEMWTLVDVPVTNKIVKMKNIKLHCPVDDWRVISCFFEDAKTSDYYKRFGMLHNGIDFAVKVGSNVYAVAEGTVSSVVENEWGKWVDVQHEWGKSTYGHLNEFLVKQGDKVENGQRIAKSGNTGKMTTGAHLHCGIKPDVTDTNYMNGWINFLPYLFTGQTIEDKKGRAYFVDEGTMHWSPDILTFYSYGLIPEDIIKFIGNNTYDEIPNRMPLGSQMEYKGSKHEVLFNSLRKNKIIIWR